MVYNSIEAILNDDKFLNTRFAFLTGKSATGKTYFGNRLKEKGYVFIPLDDLLINDVNKKFNLTQKESIEISRGLASEEVENYTIRRISEEIEKYSEVSKVVLEGTMTSLRFLKRVFEKYNYDFTVIFLYPQNHEKYLKRVEERLIRDINENIQTLPIWHNFDNKIAADFKVNGMQSKLFKDYVIYLTDALFNSNEERYQIFKNSDLKLITVFV